jgi:hypothetical protein
MPATLVERDDSARADDSSKHALDLLESFQHSIGDKPGVRCG